MTSPARSGTRRILFGLVLLAVLAGLALLARPMLFAEQTPTMMTSAVTRGDIEETVLATGILKPVRLVAVGAQVSGRVTAVKVALGETIRKGDLIAEIDSLTQESSLRTAEADLANIRAQRAEKEATLVNALSTLQRQTKMVAQKATSQADYEAAIADVATTKAQIAALDAQITAAEAAIETAKVNLGYTRIIAPIDGTVLAIVTQEGQTVNAAQSAPTIVILGQLDTMTVRAEISEADIVKVKPGQSLYFTIVGDPDHRYEATLGSIEPAPESIKSDSSFSSSTSTSSTSSSSSSSSSEAIYYIGVFDVPNVDGRLRTYMTAEVHILLGAAKGALTIPAAALGGRQADGSYTVRVVEGNGAVAVRAVEVGLNDKVTAEIRSGLSEGERVVTGQLSSAPAAGAPRSGGPPPMGL